MDTVSIVGRGFLRAVVLTVVFASVSSARADIVTVGPFNGTASDTFNQYGNTMAVLSLPVLGGLGSLQMLSPGGAIKVEFSSQLGSDLVTPISGMMAGQLGIAQWVFNEPVVRFGAWWENNSGANDATVQFYDGADALIGTMTAFTAASAQQWTWNGWESSTPISRIKVTGNGLVNGFLWYENVQAVVVPTPPLLMVPVIAIVVARRRRR